jgi:hypothetical protein
MLLKIHHKYTSHHSFAASFFVVAAITKCIVIVIVIVLTYCVKYPLHSSSTRAVCFGIKRDYPKTMKLLPRHRRHAVINHQQKKRNREKSCIFYLFVCLILLVLLSSLLSSLSSESSIPCFCFFCLSDDDDCVPLLL